MSTWPPWSMREGLSKAAAVTNQATLVSLLCFQGHLGLKKDVLSRWVHQPINRLEMSVKPCSSGLAVGMVPWLLGWAECFLERKLRGGWDTKGWVPRINSRAASHWPWPFLRVCWGRAPMLHEGLRDAEGKLVIQIPIRQRGFGCELRSGHIALDFHNIHALRSGAERQESTHWLTEPGKNKRKSQAAFYHWDDSIS